MVLTKPLLFGPCPKIGNGVEVSGSVDALKLEEIVKARPHQDPKLERQYDFLKRRRPHPNINVLETVTGQNEFRIKGIDFVSWECPSPPRCYEPSLA